MNAVQQALPFDAADETPATVNALVPRATIKTLVRQRNEALEAFEKAHGMLVLSCDAVKSANSALLGTCGGDVSYTHHIKDEQSIMLSAVKLPSLTDYLKTARRLVDTNVWAHLIRITDLERLMDKKAKDQFRQQLMDEPPEVTEDNVYATLEQFVLDAGTIFKRGIAECFTQLDRRFRSHDGWEIGSRIILTYAFDENGWWNHHRNHRDSFTDVERVFRMLDDNPASYCEMVSALEKARGAGHGARQTEIETQYFTVRAFKNGNAHIWFKRDDLLEKVNQLLGEYYGAPIPEDREPDPNTGLYDAKTLPAKRYGFFPTPADAALLIVEDLPLSREKDQPRIRVLEPSAGTGNLAKLCAGPFMDGVRSRNDYIRDAIVDCIEIQPQLAEALRRLNLGKVWCANFLGLSPETTGIYDIICMNPPFDRERDIDHVLHALKFLKPGGTLVAIMSAGTEFRNTRKSQAFRELIETMEPKGYSAREKWRDLPERSFSSVGTNCNTIRLKIRKPS